MAIENGVLELIHDNICSHHNPQIKEIHGICDSKNLTLLILAGFKKPNPLNNYLIGYFTWKNERLFKFMYDITTKNISMDEVIVRKQNGETWLHTIEITKPFTTPDALDVNTPSEWIYRNGTPEDKAVRHLFDQINIYFTEREDKNI